VSIGQPPAENFGKGLSAFSRSRLQMSGIGRWLQHDRAAFRRTLAREQIAKSLKHNGQLVLNIYENEKLNSIRITTELRKREKSIREQEMQIVDGEALRKLFFAKNVLGEGVFLFLKLPNLFLDAVFDQ
jgi:hypothetical protein